MIEHAGALAGTVHGPHRRPDVDARHAEASSDDRPDGAAATKIAAMRVVLVGHAGFLTQDDEACGTVGTGAVALAGVDFDHRTAVDRNTMAGLVGAGEIRVVSVRHVGADEETAGQRTAIGLVVESRAGSDAP